jgi:hypothetical protein
MLIERILYENNNRYAQIYLSKPINSFSYIYVKVKCSNAVKVKKLQIFKVFSNFNEYQLNDVFDANEIPVEDIE